MTISKFKKTTMTKKGQFDELEWHRKTAVKLFNATWDLIDKKDRTIEDNDEMIHSAHSSR